MLREPLLSPDFAPADTVVDGGACDQSSSQQQQGWHVTDRHAVSDAAGHRRGYVLVEEEASDDGAAAARRRRRRSSAGSYGGGGGAADSGGGTGAQEMTRPADTWRVCVFNLAKVVLGAGMMAMPKAFYLLGSIPGTLFFLAIGWLTFYTLARGLVHTTDALGTARSYSALVDTVLGQRAERVLQLSIFTTCWAMQVVMLVMAGDILVGDAPDYGLIYQMTGLDSWPFVSRPAVLCVLCALVLVPLGTMRSMDALAGVNIVGVGSNALMAALCMALCAGAVIQGVASVPPLWPQWGALVSAAGGQLGAGLMLASTLPVILNCFSCHQSLHPLLPCLRPYSTQRAQSMVGAALTVAGILNYIVAICAGAAFGPALKDDVLSNITVDGISPLIGGPAIASVACLAVRLGFLLSLLGSFLLLLFPLRHVLADVLLGGHEALNSRWIPVTICVTTAAYLTATLLKSIYGALSLVGATATTVLSWVLPALLVLAVEKGPFGSGSCSSTSGTAAASEAAAHLLAAEAAERGKPAAAGADEGGAAGQADAAAARAERAWHRAVAVLILVIGILMFAQAIVGAMFDRLQAATSF